MSDLIIQRNTLEGIASAIREKTGSTEGILVKDLAIEIKDLEVTGEQTRPEISVGEDGLITATAGKKTSTYQMAFQPAVTIIPSNTEQIAVSSGYYTGGNIVVAGDENLIAENIVSGKSIFGVNGAADLFANEDAIITRGISGAYANDRVENIGSFAFVYCPSLTSVLFPACTSIEGSAFKNCSGLTSVSFPACTNIGSFAFGYCSNLTSISFPVCTNIGEYAFNGCVNLTTVSFPVCTYIETYAFAYCSKLTSVSLPVCTSIGSYAFSKCYMLSSLILGASTVCTLVGSTVFSSTPYTGYRDHFSGTPHIYVPSSLIDAYKSATKWSYFKSYFSAIEDMPT